MNHLHVLNLVFPFLCVAAILLAVFLYKNVRTDERIERFMAAAAPIVILFVVARIVNESLLAPLQIWDTVHLLGAYLLADGKRLFYPEATGPILDMMYGPVMAISYWPVTLLTRNPAWAAGFAKSVTLFYFLAPSLWLCRRVDRDYPRRRIFVIYVFLAYLYFAFRSPALAGSAFWIHADAPALGWSGLSCMIIYLKKHRESWHWMALSALFAALGMWTKQVLFPLPVGLALYLAITEGAVSVARYFFYFTGASFLTTCIFCGWFGFDNLWFNLITNPSSQPWHRDMMKTEGWAIVELMERLRWPSIVIFLFCVFHRRSNSVEESSSLRDFYDRYRWSLFMLVATLMVPAALVGRMRMGGDLNALSFSTYFMALGLLTLAIQFVAANSSTDDYRFGQTFVKKLMFAYVLSAMLVEVPTLSYYFVCLPKYLHRLETNPASVAYEFSKKHPGVVYMPWNCLETYLAEGKIYHFEYAIFDRELGNLTPTLEHFRAGLPPGMKYVGYPFNEQARHVMKYFPDYVFESTLPELPGWTLYAATQSPGGRFVDPDNGAPAPQLQLPSRHFLLGPQGAAATVSER